MSITLNADTSSGLVMTSDTSGEIKLQSAGTDTVTVDSSGNVGIGTSSPSTPLAVSGISSLGVDQTDYVQLRGGGGTARVEGVGGSTNVNIALSAKGAGAYYLWGNGYGNNALMLIDQFANLTLGYTSEATVNFNGMTAGAYFDVKHPSSASSGYAYERFFWNGSIIGQIVQNGTTGVTYNTSSDYRLKENNVDITDGITRVKQLNPYRFNFISEPNRTVDGFFAHEVQSVVPEAITGTHNEVEVWKDGEELPEGVSVGDTKTDENGNPIPVYQGIDQAKLVPLLTAALQEAITKIEDLETRIQVLENA